MVVLPIIRQQFAIFGGNFHFSNWLSRKNSFCLFFGVWVYTCEGTDACICEHTTHRYTPTSWYKHIYTTPSRVIHADTGHILHTSSTTQVTHSSHDRREMRSIDKPKAWNMSEANKPSEAKVKKKIRLNHEWYHKCYHLITIPGSYELNTMSVANNSRRLK